MRRKITDRAISSLRSEAAKRERDLFLWDTELRGLGAKATSKGHVAWIVQKWIGGRGGKAQRMVIGHCPPMDIDTARIEAGAVIGDTFKGVDIVSRKKQQRTAQRERLEAATLSEAWEAYHKRRSEPGRFWSELQGRFENEIIPALGKDTRVAEITKAQVRHLIETKEEKYPVAARTMFEALRPFFKWCVERDLITVSPLADLQPPQLASSRDRILSDIEIKAFWKATDTLGFPFGPFYRLCLLTGQRREEVAGMSRDEIDGNTWTIPKERTKNGKAHVVHLSEQAIAVLATIDPIEGCPFVFTTTGESTISGYSKAKARLDTLMLAALAKKKLQPWRVHDLRRTAASGMAMLGFPPHIVERVLNHISGANGGLVAVYQRYEYLDERKRAIEAWGTYVAALTGGKPMAVNVIPIRA